MTRSLVLAITRLGDLIQSEPMIRTIKRTGQADHVTILVEESFAPVAQQLNCVDEIRVIDFGVMLGKLDKNEADIPFAAYSEMAQWLEKSDYDSVYNVTHSRPSMMLAALAHRDTVGVTLSSEATQVVNNRWFQYFFATNLARPWCSFNLVDIYVNAVNPLTTVEERSPFLKTTKEKLKSLSSWSDCECVLHVGASQSDKQWPLDKFTELSRELLRRGARVTLIGGAKAEAISSVFPTHRRFTDRTGQTTVADLVELFGSADMLISADSGPVHVAAACGLPIVAIEGGSAHGFETAPYVEGAIVIQPHLDELINRTPGKKHTSASADRVSMQTVLSALEFLVGERKDIVVSKNCTVYKTTMDRKIPGLGLRALAGSHSQYEEWQQKLRVFWWSVIGAGDETMAQTDCELSSAAGRAALAANAICSRASNVAELKRQSLLLSKAERELGLLIQELPPLHCLNSFLQIARGSVKGETVAEQAHELEALYEKISSAAKTLDLSQGITKDNYKTKYIATEAIS